MKRYKLDFSSDPSFNTVTGLSNTTFNPTTTVENRMATEAQIQELYRDIVAAEQRRDYCCRDIIVWEAHTQIVRMNTLNISGNKLANGGAVISDFNENVNIGTMRRGLDYTVTFPVKWNSELYTVRNIAARANTDCIMSAASGYWEIVNYRIVEDDSITVGNCQSTSTNYARFWWGVGATLSQYNNVPEGAIINPNGNWGSFIHDIKDDGTVTITDHRRNTNFNVIRFYTQWILRRTADNQLIPDPE